MTSTSTLTDAKAERCRPGFFEDIREKAHARWDQLDADPELAGPWLLLFSQVQSPRHVLSELLQNADDAGATTANARFVGDTFVFSHDGKDFDQSQFASLCRFGFSNKRNLHTIGFRGIGFKSTFSLGNQVEVCTPSIAVRFEKRRFTEPIWIEQSVVDHQTWVRVPVADRRRRDELETNMGEWAASPFSLLFFNNIRRLVINGQVIEKRVVGQGPVPDSEKVEISGIHSQSLLLLRSPEEEFPADAVAEINQERFSEDFYLPPCRVELVLNATTEPRFYVVLPTDVRPNLPFSCNAPFLQDPARRGIKPPSTSPTNRWLLQRLGSLAAKAMSTWLSNSSLSLDERAAAYALVPPPLARADSDESKASAAVCHGFSELLGSSRPTLTTAGTIVDGSSCLVPPHEIYAIWDSGQILSTFAAQEKHLIAPEITNQDRKRLAMWDWYREYSRGDVVARLSGERHAPRPTAFDQVARLWCFAKDHVGLDYGGLKQKKLQIIPVQGDTELYSAEEVIRLPASRTLPDEEWEFLHQFLAIVDQEWLATITSPDDPDTPRQRHKPTIDKCRALLDAVGLASASTWDKVLNQASARFFSPGEFFVEDLVRFTRILAVLNAQVPSDFQYVARDGQCRLRGDGFIHDPRGDVEALVTESWADQHLLAPAYSEDFATCSRDAWNSWAASEKSGLLNCLPVLKETKTLWIKRQLLDLIDSRGGNPPESYPYRRNEYLVTDFDFPAELVAHWEQIAVADPGIWSRVYRSIAGDTRQQWYNKLQATVSQSGNTYVKPVECGPLPAQWIVRLRSLRCLADTFGTLCEPAELLMRSPDTEAFMGVERFVRAEDDTEKTKPLLRLLGVRDTPTSPDKLLERIRVLSSMEIPLVHEIAKWYEALDRILVRCRPDDFASIKNAMRDKPLLLTDSGEWARLGEVFLEADELDIPDVPLVHPTVRSLSMWSRLGIATRPTPALVLNWLRQLPTGKRLEGPELRRVRALLKRYPIQVWGDCGHWLSLDGTWEETGRFDFQVSMRHLARSADIFPAFKGRTADLKMLSAEFLDQAPFDSLDGLGSVIEYRLTRRQTDLPAPANKPWLSALGKGLSRIAPPESALAEETRALGDRIAKTIWQEFRQLQVTPYIENTPAGADHSPEVLWYENTLFVHEGPVSKRFNEIVAELARPFAWTEISNIIRACAERDAAFVAEFIQSNYEVDAEPIDLPPQSAIDTVIDEDRPTDSVAGQLPDDGVRSSEPAPALSTAAPGLGSPEFEEQTAEAYSEEALDDTSDEPTGFVVDESDDLDQPEDQEPSAEPAPPRPETPPLMHRFAKGLGFRWDSSRERFQRSDGAWIEKAHGEAFNWHQYSATGVLVLRYWANAQSLANSGVEVPAEVWELTRRAPESSTWVLEDADKQAVAISGSHLLHRVDTEKSLMLFPAKYRIRETVE